MTPNRSNLPPLPRLLSALPTFPGSVLFAGGLTLALSRRLPEDVRHALAGKRFCIRVLDAGLSFHFGCDGRRFLPERGQGTPDLQFSAKPADFIALLRRQEDPDTLFFSRRLVMEGDTELGLLVKNSLDAIELLPPQVAQWLPDALAARLRAMR